jgi:hypothetical protein
MTQTQSRTIIEHSFPDHTQLPESDGTFVSGSLNITKTKSRVR